MKIKHHDIVISNENPFKYCKLEREPYAKVLTDIVGNYADGFVLAINNEWGTGKTTFVKMWQKQLEIEGFQTIYFNAWENDFDSNPIVALMSELETLTNAKNRKVFKSVVEKGAVFVKNIAPALAKSLIKKYLADIDELAIDAIENATKASTEIFKEEIKEYSSKKKTIIEFRDELEKFIKQANNTKPLIFIVDELDRCRPDYSVEVLEKIKHFFSVRGIVFALSIDKEHLSSSIRGYYGSEQINTEEYLRRFIDLEYSLPKPKTESYIKYLVEYYAFVDLLQSRVPQKVGAAKATIDGMILIAELIFTRTNPSLRQQEKVFALFRIVTCSFENFVNVQPHLLFLLSYLKVCMPSEFRRLIEGTLSAQELLNLFASLFPDDQHPKMKFNVDYLESLFLYLYFQKIDSEKIYVIQSSNTLDWDTVKFRCKYVQSLSTLQSKFNEYGRTFRTTNIDFLFNKVNLMESLNFE